MLGPVEAVGRDGAPMPVRGQPLRLLGLLLVGRGAPIPADEAIEALWHDRLPAHPANALQLVVGRLRRAIGANAVVWDGGAYALCVDGPDAIDADRFERLAGAGEIALADGDPARAGDLLARALELWRGSPLQSVRYEAYAAPEIARLDERRLRCLGARIDAELALGRAERVIDELTGLVVEHPLHGPFRRQLVRALAESGRWADAIAAHRAAGRALSNAGLPPPPTGPARVPGPEQAGRGRREVICLAVDLRPSLAGGVLDPEVRAGVMAACTDAAEATVLGYGEPVFSRGPQGLIAVLGALRANEDEALRALRAATALQRTLAELADELGVGLEVRIGIAAGTAFVAARDALPSGEVVAAAARLAHGAGAGELVLGDCHIGVPAQENTDVSAPAKRPKATRPQT